MNNLYEETMTVAAQLRVARLKVVQLSTQLNGLVYKLGVAAARIERGLIKKVGDEKKLGPSLDSRERIFVLARDADQEYLALWQSRETVNEQLEIAKVEVKYLQDKMAVMLTAAKTYGE
jgi:hypothetical protein